MTYVGEQVKNDGMKLLIDININIRWSEEEFILFFYTNKEIYEMYIHSFSIHF